MMLRYMDSYADGIGNVLLFMAEHLTNTTSSSFACFGSRSNLSNHVELPKDFS